MKDAIILWRNRKSDVTDGKKDLLNDRQEVNMIEVVYDRDTEDKRKRNVPSKSGGTENTPKLPKNIRQIGNASDKRKIYIEDYVMTFLRKIAEPGNSSARGAILLGEYFKDGENETLFIYGAVEAQNLEFDVEQIKFDDHIWSNIYAESNKYFENLSVVGWFLSRMGFSIEINESIARIHRENFPGRDKVLFVMDTLECEDAFYMLEKGKLVRQRGYYIYYVRNEAMQNYIISRKNQTTENKETAVLRKDTALVTNLQDFREKEKRKDKKNSQGGSYFMYAVSSFAVVFAISMGIAVTGSYDKMKDIESAVRQIEQQEKGVEVFSDNKDANAETLPEISGQTTTQPEKTSSEAGQTEPQNGEAASQNEDANAALEISQESGQQTGIDEQENNQNTQAENSVAESTTGEQSTASQYDIFTYYEVEEGDTLMSISIKMYNSPNYVDYIMEANGIKEGDTIYVGQKIAIPYVE